MLFQALAEEFNGHDEADIHRLSGRARGGSSKEETKDTPTAIDNSGPRVPLRCEDTGVHKRVDGPRFQPRRPCTTAFHSEVGGNSRGTTDCQLGRVTTFKNLNRL